jgi:hypothetical protein
LIGIVIFVNLPAGRQVLSAVADKFSINAETGIDRMGVEVLL